SIYVNPTQFSPDEDFSQYPRPFAQDCKKADKYGCDILFNPSSDSMYPTNYMTYVCTEDITTKLEGAIRPEHFKGVTTIVTKLFNIVTPDFAVFGQKDAQQTIVLKRMVEDLNMNVKIIIRPTIREKGGLALSSRNSYLSGSERADAQYIYSSLCIAEEKYKNGEKSTDVIKESMLAEFKNRDYICIEYLEFVDMITLKPIKSIIDKTLVAIACRTKESNTRLIDNTILHTSENTIDKGDT
ncbi:MAG: pantoate--beta-alanine ligase, partial [Chitinispirillia bacterium]